MTLRYPKPIRLESPAYLKYIRSQQCCVGKCFQKAQAHHLVFNGQGRIGSKVSDFQAVACCSKHHLEFHALGRDEFAAKYGLNFEQIIIDLLSDYITQMK